MNTETTATREIREISFQDLRRLSPADYSHIKEEMRISKNENARWENLCIGFIESKLYIAYKDDVMIPLELGVRRGKIFCIRRLSNDSKGYIQSLDFHFDVKSDTIDCKGYTELDRNKTGKDIRDYLDFFDVALNRFATTHELPKVKMSVYMKNRRLMSFLKEKNFTALGRKESFYHFEKLLF